MKKVRIHNIYSSAQSKILKVEGEPGDFLKEHQISQAAILIVTAGSIRYIEGDKIIVLSPDDTHDIPANHLHEVQVVEDAKFYILLAKEAKIEFTK